MTIRKTSSTSDQIRKHESTQGRRSDLPPADAHELRELNPDPNVDTRLRPEQPQLSNRANNESSHTPLETARLAPSLRSSEMPRGHFSLRSSPALGGSSLGTLPVHDPSSSSSPSGAEEGGLSIPSGDARRRGRISRRSDPAGSGILARETPGRSSSLSGDAAPERRDHMRRKLLKKTRERKTMPSLSGAWEGPNSHDSTQKTHQHSSTVEDSRKSPSVREEHVRFQEHSPDAESDTAFDGTPDNDEDDDDTLSSRGDPEDPPDNSPYSQVRASVAAMDDTSLSINTPRMWTLSLLFAILGSSTNLFFSLRYPSVSITPVIALLLVHPLGLLWDRLLRCDGDGKEVFSNGSLESRDISASPPTEPNKPSVANYGYSLRLWLAQGRWNAKEHACVYISSNISFGFAFATDVIVEQTKFYNQEVSISYQILLTISTQVLGYAIAGITRRFLVRPSGMIWPSTLMSTTMFSTLHKNENKPANGWRVSPMKFFFYVFSGSVAFYFLPGLLMPALSYFSVITWFAPQNVVVANLFGVASGLGMFPLTFDWSQIAYIGSPLVVPFWAAVNIIVGLVVVMWIVAPLLYYSNFMYTAYMPILSATVFDNTGKPYDVSKILTKDFLFDSEAYRNYSRVFLPITYALSYALQFAALASLITHTACWHGKDMWTQWKASLREIRDERKGSYQRLPQSTVNRARPVARSSNLSEPLLDNLMQAEDVHSRLMKRYEDVPIWWYLITGLSMTAVGIFVVEYFPVHLPWYGLLMALGICAILFIPIGIVMAISNQQCSLYLICQLICGVVFPGRPVANMVFVTYGYITSTQGLKFSSDLKLGQYMKIPPRILFVVQLSATIVSALTQIGVLNWMLANIPGICTPAAVNGFTCPIARVHFNGSILWGLVGPARFFGHGALYRPLIWAFPVGALAPIVTWWLGRKKRKSLWRSVNLPVLFGGLSWIPPATGLNFSVWGLVCWFFNDAIRRHRGAWWRKYNMTLSAALDSGLAVGVVIIFFGVIFPGWSEGFHWWGTEVYKQGCDWRACAYREVRAGERFGPGSW